MAREFPRHLHYALVRVGGQPGRLLRCERRDRTGFFWKVKLETGEWVWPDQTLTIDAPGKFTERCAECELPFRTDTVGETLCPRCDQHWDRLRVASYADGGVDVDAADARIEGRDRDRARAADQGLF